MPKLDWEPFTSVIGSQRYTEYKRMVRTLKPRLRRAYALAFAIAEMQVGVTLEQFWDSSESALCSLYDWCGDCPARESGGGFGTCGIVAADKGSLKCLQDAYRKAYNKLPAKYKS